MIDGTSANRPGKTFGVCVSETLTLKGKAVTHNAYGPYGETQTKGRGDYRSDFRYAEMLYHAASGMYLTLYRAYDPSVGRWVSRDPIGEDGGINLYGYANGNPVSLTDPNGLTANDKWYGYNDRTFQRWVHSEKQIMGRAPNENFTQDELKDLVDQWKQLGCPAPGRR